ncbi:MAG TPA: hypothetical protein VFS91_06400 [Nitrobacter sp.]|jgi:hypothetical protein|nr:hypothetical protein [Nitrobacter sp.]
MWIALVRCCGELRASSLHDGSNRAKLKFRFHLQNATARDHCEIVQSSTHLLLMYSDRAQGRAVRRMGELLKQFDGSTRNKDAAAPVGSEGALITQKQVAEAARISDHRRVQAVRVANVPAAQADALEIEAGAKRRLADEYDAAQERGEVASGSVRTDIIPEQNDVRPATAAEVLGDGAHKLLHEARLIRDAEAADPGIVRRALDEKLACPRRCVPDQGSDAPYCG